MIRARLRENPGLVLSLLIIALFTIAWVTAGGFPARARIYPRYLIGAGLILALLHLGIELWRPLAPERHHGTADLKADDTHSLAVATRLAAPEFGWLAGLLVAIYLIGAIIPLPVYVITYAKKVARVSWKTAGAMGFALFAIMIGVFEHFLHFSWPRGVFTVPQRLLLTLLRDVGI